MKGFEVVTHVEVTLHPHHIIAVLSCGTTFALSYGTGGRNYAIMDNSSIMDTSSTMDVLPEKY